MKHTPTPWGKTYIAHQDGKNSSSYYKVSGAQRSVCRTIDQLAGPEDEANIDFIVRACNCHDELVGVLRELVKDIEVAGVGMVDRDWPDLSVTYRHAREALAKVGS